MEVDEALRIDEAQRNLAIDEALRNFRNDLVLV